ncbi:hypothetical protein [Specibacter cremeus]|uniref:hypothetical protein n=1 Tax=Specibacter cremeus TaxID=1629051 RepID=UPI000F78D41A|nr:hypothetical protein [Specibacter cremeus]
MTGERLYRRVDRRALAFAIGFPVALAIAFVISGLFLAGGLPHGVVLPVGGNPLPVGVYLPVGGIVVAGVGAGIGTQAARTVLPRQLRRILLGLSMTVQLALCSLFGAAMVGQTGGPGLPPQRVDLQVLATGCGAAVALGVVLAMTFKPDEQWTPADDAAFERALESDHNPQAAADRLEYWTRPRGTVITMILLCGVFPGALLSVLTPWLLLAATVAAVFVVGFLSALVGVDREGVSVKLAGVVPVITVPSTDVVAAVSLDVAARDYGGWGLRKHDGSATFLASSGAAVVLRLDGGRSLAIGAPDLDVADAAAAILNRRAGKAPQEK